ncbi:MAG: Ig-like domain-containing protein [Acidobacteriota bacterium]
MHRESSFRSTLRALLLVALGALTLAAGSASAQIVLEAVPDRVEIPPGGSLNVEVAVSGLGAFAAPSLGAYDVQLTFDPAVFDLTEAVSGLELGDPTLGQVISVATVGDGTYDALEISLLPPADLITNQDERVVLFVATFDAIAPGAGVFDLGLNSPLADELGNPLTVVIDDPVTVTTLSPLEIPTLDTVGLLLLVLTLVFSGWFLLRRQSQDRRSLHSPSQGARRGGLFVLLFLLISAPLLAMPGDIDGDDDVDVNDINLILAANGSSVTAGDARDLDGDLLITVLDMRQAAVLCSRPLCAPNTAPAITPPANQTTPEDVATGPLAFTADDADGDSLTLTLTTSDPALIPLGNLTLGGTQPNYTVNAQPAADLNGGPVTITLTADDGITTSAATFQITVSAVNDPPTITTATAFSVPENQTAVADVDSTDPEGDTDGAGLTYSLTGAIDDALFAIDADSGVLTFLTAPDFEMPADTGGDNVYDLEVTVTDSGGLTDVQNVAVTVTGVNDCPTAVDDALATDEDTILNGNVLAANPTTADSDPEGDALTVTAVNGDAANVGVQIPLGMGLLTVEANGAVSFDPTGGYEFLNDTEFGTETFTYTIDDGSGSCAESATVTITIDGINDPPSITSSDTASAAENQTAVIDVSSTDPEGDTEGSGLTYSITGAIDDALFAIDANTGVVTFRSAPDFEAPADTGGDNVYNLEVTVTDSGTLTDVQALAVTVTGVNDCPIAVDDALATDEETALNGNLLAANPTTADSDPEGDALTVTAVNGNAANVGVQIPLGDGLLTVLASGAVSFDPDGGYDDLPTGSFEQESFTYTIDDGSRSCAESATVTITINGINDIPMITSDGGGATAALSAGENQTAVTDVQATDIEGDSEGSGLTYSLTGGAQQAFFLVNPATGVLTFAAPLDFEKPVGDGDNTYEVEVTVTDSAGGTDAQTLTITVTDVNEAPLLAAGKLSFVDEDVFSVGLPLGLRQAQVVATSQDGRFVYTGGEDYLTVWSRDSTTGEVTFVESFEDDVDGIDGLADPGELVLSPDGRHLYISARGDFSVALYDRDTATGQLTFVEALFDDTAPIPSVTLEGADALAFSPDGLHLYVGTESGRWITVFSRDPASGRLTLVEVVRDVIDAPNLAQVHGIVVSADGNHVYTAARADNAVNVFRRDPATGELTFIEDIQDGDPGADRLQQVVKVALSCDGKNLYAVAISDSAITVFDRDDNPVSATYGQLTPVQIIRDGVPDAMNDGLDSVEDLRVSADDRHVFTASGRESSDHAIVTFSRDPATGLLTHRDALFDGTNGADNLLGVTQLDLSDDGRHLYAVSFGDFSLTVFSREVSSARFAVGDGPTLLLPSSSTDFTVNDQDDASLESVTVTITNLIDAGQEFLATSASGAIGAGDISYVAPTLTIAPAGGAPLADFEAVLDSLTYDNTFDVPSAGDRVIEIVADDGSETSNTFTALITVLNLPPMITSDGGGDTAAVNVASGSTAVTDVQATDLEGDVEGAGLTYGLTDSDGAGPLGADNALFTLVPGTGVLTFTAAPDVSAPSDSDGDNDYEVEVTVTDSGGETDTQNLTVTVFNPPPSGVADTFDFVGNTLLRVDQPTSGGAEILGTTGSGTGVLDNDSDPNNAISVAGVVANTVLCTDLTAPFGDGPTCPTTNGGTVVMQSTGEFTYTPLAGDTATDDSFSYRLTDGTTTVEVLVQLNRQNRVWYVDNTNASGTDDGSSVDPFDTLAEAESASVAGDTIYIFEGDGTDTGLDTGFSLKSAQRLLGEGVDLSIADTVNGVAGPTLFDSSANNRPALSSSDTSVVLANAGSSSLTDLEIRGLFVTGSTFGINVLATGNFMVEATITDNLVTFSSENGIQVLINGDSGTSPSGVVLLDNNTVERYDLFGVRAAAFEGTAELDITLTNNLVDRPGAPSADGFRIESGNFIEVQSPRVCLDLLDVVPPIGDNNSAFPIAFDESIELQQFDGATFQLEGLAASDCGGIPCSGTNAQRVEDFILDNNERTANVRTVDRIVDYTDATCALPSP